MVALLAGVAGLLEIVVDRPKGAENRAVGGDAAQVFIPAARSAGPMGKDGRGRLVEIRRLAQLLGQPQEGCSLAGVQGQAADGLDAGAVDALPLNAALGGGGKAPVIERAVQHALEGVPLEDLRQHGRQAESSPAEDGRTPIEVFGVSCESAAKLPLDGLDVQERQAALAVFSADQAGPLVGQGLLKRGERGRLAAGHLFDDLGRQEQVSRRPAGQFGLQRFSQRAG